MNSEELLQRMVANRPTLSTMGYTTITGAALERMREKLVTDVKAFEDACWALDKMALVTIDRMVPWRLAEDLNAKHGFNLTAGHVILASEVLREVRS